MLDVVRKHNVNRHRQELDMLNIEFYEDSLCLDVIEI